MQPKALVYVFVGVATGVLPGVYLGNHLTSKPPNAFEIPRIVDVGDVVAGTAIPV